MKDKVRYNLRLPDGSHTSSSRKYIDTWRELGVDVCFIMGWVHLDAFDPDLAFSKKDGSCVSLSAEVALKLVELHRRCQEMSREQRSRCF